MAYTTACTTVQAVIFQFYNVECMYMYMSCKLFVVLAYNQMLYCAELLRLLDRCFICCFLQHSRMLCVNCVHMRGLNAVILKLHRVVLLVSLTMLIEHVVSPRLSWSAGVSGVLWLICWNGCVCHMFPILDFSTAA